MNAQMAKVAELDPAYVKSERWRELRFYGALFLALVAIAGATWAVVVNGEQEREITQVQHSACQTDASSRECQKTKAEAARAASVPSTCISFLKVGYPCPNPESDVHTSGHNAAPYKEGGGGSNGGNTPPSSQPSPSETGGGQTIPPSESANPGVLNPVTESPVVKPLLPECHVTALGIEVCN